MPPCARLDAIILGICDIKCIRIDAPWFSISEMQSAGWMSGKFRAWPISLAAIISSRSRAHGKCTREPCSLICRARLRILGEILTPPRSLPETSRFGGTLVQSTDITVLAVNENYRNGYKSRAVKLKFTNRTLSRASFLDVPLTVANPFGDLIRLKRVRDTPILNSIWEC